MAGSTRIPAAEVTGPYGGLVRSNTALGIEAHGFAAACELAPLAEPTSYVRSAA